MVTTYLSSLKTEMTLGSFVPLSICSKVDPLSSCCDPYSLISFDATLRKLVNLGAPTERTHCGVACCTSTEFDKGIEVDCKSMEVGSFELGTIFTF